MNALTETFVGSQYLMDGKTYEVINLTQELISLRDINGKREQYFQPDDFQGLLFNKEVTLFQRAPLQDSNATFFLHSSDPHVIEAQRKYYYVERLKIIFRGALPKKYTLEEIDKLSKKYGDKSPPCYTSVWTWTRLCRTHSWSPFVLLKKRSSLPRGKVTPETTMQIVDRYINEEYLSSQKIR